MGVVQQRGGRSSDASPWRHWLFPCIRGSTRASLLSCGRECAFWALGVECVYESHVHRSLTQGVRAGSTLGCSLEASRGGGAGSCLRSSHVGWPRSPGPRALSSDAFSPAGGQAGSVGKQ